jgi:hypothetical protein
MLTSCLPLFLTCKRLITRGSMYITITQSEYPMLPKPFCRCHNVRRRTMAHRNPMSLIHSHIHPTLPLWPYYLETLLSARPAGFEQGLTLL